MRIAIVNDVMLAVESLRRYIEGHPEFELAWVALDGQEAVERARADRPDLILMDLVMPRMDGIEATRRIMRDSPTAILIVTASVDRLTAKVFEALGAGALDATDTPVLHGREPGQTSLHRKVETIARLLGPRPQAQPQPQQRKGLVVIGASSGGPAALATLLSRMPADYPVPIAIVQHIDLGFMKGLAEWLDGQTRLPVVLAQDHEKPVRGKVYMAATDRHMVLDAQGQLCYGEDAREMIHRPSVDVFFRSVAANWTGSALGIILTGMGSDGAQGLLELRRRGFATLAQDEATSSIYGMPRAAVQCGAAEAVLPLDAIAERMHKFARMFTLVS